MPVDQGICHIFCVRLFLRNLAPEDLHYQIIPKAVERISGQSPKKAKKMLKIAENSQKLVEIAIPSCRCLVGSLGTQGNARKTHRRAGIIIQLIIFYN